MVDFRVFPFADVAVLGLDGFAVFGRLRAGILLSEVLGRVDVGRREDGLTAEDADAGFLEDGTGAFGGGGVALAFGGLHAAAAGDGVRQIELRDGEMEPLAVFGRKLVEKFAAGIEVFEKFGGALDASMERGNIG